MKGAKVITCKKCVNNSKNKFIAIGKDGLCNVCREYIDKFNKEKLEEEQEFFKTFIKGKDYDIMVGISGGKDSSAALYTVKEMGFSPLAFTFKIGYLPESVYARAKKVAEKMAIKHEEIDINKYVSDTDRKCMELMANLYDEEDSEELKEKFLELYTEGRKHYSNKINIEFPFVRPCQLCRKIAIKAYYGEALKRGVQVIAIGMNEWTGLSAGVYSAIRKLQPDQNKPPVYIVHLPFLLQRKLRQTKQILEEIGWEKPEDEKLVDTGARCCLMAEACEAKAERMLGFSLDSTRLAREVTVGFITKKEALAAMEVKASRKSLREVFEDGNLISKKKNN